MLNQDAQLEEESEDPEERRARIKDNTDERLDLLKEMRKQSKMPEKGKKKESKGVEEAGKEEEGGKEKEGEEEKPGTAGGEGTGVTAEDEKFLDEDTGSVASSTKSLMKHLRMLRNALYENYSPPSIRNLRLNGRLVIIVLLIITIFWFVYSASQYS